MSGLRLCIVGSEVINGFVRDSNSAFFARQLYEAGYLLRETRVLRDDPEAILAHWRELVASKDVIINSGGLGPTSDDLTVDLLARLLGREIVYDEQAQKRTLDFFQSRQADQKLLTPAESEAALQLALRQARIPAGAIALPNRAGLAPGIYIPEIRFFAFPGFPIEIESIWPAALDLIHSLGLPRSATRAFSLWGLDESMVFSRMPAFEQVETGVHALPLGSRLFLRSQAGEAPLQAAADFIWQKFGTHICENPLLELVEFLQKTGQTISTAESCSGGLAAKLLTDIPGVSAVYQGSVISYANSVKENLLQVSPADLEQYGAVSPQVAAAMALGACRATGSDYAISTTGIAGPTGGSPDKPVGTVYIGLALPVAGKTVVFTGKFFFPYGRERFRQTVVYAAFFSLWQLAVSFGHDSEKWLAQGYGRYFSLQTGPG